MAFFSSVKHARDALASTGYLVDEELATAVFLGDAMGKPLLLEGAAGTGKPSWPRRSPPARGPR